MVVVKYYLHTHRLRHAWPRAASKWSRCLVIAAICLGMVGGVTDDDDLGTKVILQPTVSPDASTASIPLQIGDCTENTECIATIQNLGTNPSGKLTFEVRTPFDSNEIKLASSENNNVAFKVRLINQLERCSSSTSTNTATETEDDVGQQISFGPLIQSTATGSMTAELVSAYQWQKSFVSITDDGCIIETQMHFSSSNGEMIEAAIESFQWDATYDSSQLEEYDYNATIWGYVLDESMSSLNGFDGYVEGEAANSSSSSETTNDASEKFRLGQCTAVMLVLIQYIFQLFQI